MTRVNTGLPVIVPAAVLAERSPLGTARGGAPRRIALADRLHIVEEPFLQIVSVRASPKTAIDAFAAACSLPLAPNTFSGTAAQSTGHFEPRAWLMINADAAPLRAIAGGQVSDLSARFAVFRLTGIDVERVLRGATSVVPGTGGFVRTFFAESYPVLLQRLGDDHVRLLVDASLAEACAAWLADAAALAGAA
jgi:heterotetrameric sarcosine oxidase gamma subunit